MSKRKGVRAALTGKPENSRIEFLRYMPVGFVTTLIDFGLLIVLTEFLSVHYLVSAAIGFIAGQTWSYVVSYRWVFASFKAKSHAHGFGTFIVLSSMGLLITELSLWFAEEHLDVYYLYAKIVASAFTSLALFFARKRFIFS